MVVEPRVKDYICTTAHPVGCAENVKNQIKYVKAQPKVEGPKKVLVIGASTGYGLASRIAVAFGYMQIHLVLCSRRNPMEEEQRPQAS